MPPTQVHEYTLKRAGLVVHVERLTVTQLLIAMKASSVAAAKTAHSEGLAINAEALRMSIRKINDEKVNYTDLIGDDLIRKLGRMRYFSQLSAVTADLYVTTRDEMEDVKKKAAISVNDFAEVWTVTLPDGRTVGLEEVGLDDLGKTLEDTEGKAKRSIGAAILLSAIAGVKRSIRSIDGKPTSGDSLKGKAWDQAFSVKETRLLGYIFDEMHAGAEEFEVGEAKPGGGTK